MSAPEQFQILTPADVAIRWQCSAAHVRKLIDNGVLPGFRIGGKLLRIRIEDVEEYERRQSTLSNEIGFEASEAQMAEERREAVAKFDTVVRRVRQRRRQEDDAARKRKS